MNEWVFPHPVSGSGGGGRCICTEHTAPWSELLGSMNEMLFNRFDWCQNGNKIWHWHCRRAKYLNFLLSNEIWLEYCLQCARCIRLLLITGRTSTSYNSPGAWRCRAAESHTQMKIRKPALLCLPPARILLPATAKSLEKSSWKLLLIYGTIFIQYPLKPHGLKHLSYEFSLKNIHDSYRFMSLLFFTLKGFVCESPTCTCVK